MAEVDEDTMMGNTKGNSMRISLVISFFILFIVGRTQSVNKDRDKPSDQFVEQLNMIVNAYVSRFETLKDKKDSKKDEWTSMVSLEGASRSYVERFLGKQSFNALFGVSVNSDSSGFYFSSLVRRVRNSKLSCCVFSEREDDHFVRWIVKDTASRFNNLAIEIDFIMMVGYHDDKSYAVRLEVYEMDADQTEK